MERDDQTEPDAGVEAPSVERARGAGRLLLIVEDHPVNRMVLERQLNTLGFAAEAAENGLDALAMWERGNYAMIITDCHMPEMDGYELTARIREREKGQVRRTPIVAATANAMQGEAETCLRAGMDGYLAKPINLHALTEILRRHLPDIPTVSSASGTSNRTSGDAAAAAIDLNVLSGICRGDRDCVNSLLAEFLRVNSEVVTAISEATGAQNRQALASLAHKLRGSSGTAGARRLAETAKDMELSAADADWRRIGAMAAEIAEAFARVREQIEALPT